MHLTAYDNCLYFYTVYLLPLRQISTEPLSVIEFGSCDVNGSLKPIFKECIYTGLDMASGKNVDVVCNGGDTPFPMNTFDVIISSSNFEHDDCFWMTFLEMCRIVKPGGYVYINAPSSGKYHGFPTDCWRFYEDSWKALQKWARRNQFEMEICEEYIDTRSVWCDNVCVYRKIDASKDKIETI